MLTLQGPQLALPLSLVRGQVGRKVPGDITGKLDAVGRRNPGQLDRRIDGLNTLIDFSVETEFPDFPQGCDVVLSQFGMLSTKNFQSPQGSLWTCRCGLGQQNNGQTDHDPARISSAGSSRKTQRPAVDGIGDHGRILGLVPGSS